MAGVVLGIQPMVADDGDDDIALRDLGIELLHEVQAGLHGVDVHEQPAAGKRAR